MKRLISVKKASFVVGLCILGLWSFNSSASVATSGPAPSSYGAASHSTTKWQELNDINNVSDSFGVSWSVDGGTTWGHNNLQVGQTVQFKFNLHKKNVGTHESDHLKAWLDWNQNGVFDANEVLAYGEHNLLPAEQGNLGTNNTSPNVPDFSFISAEHKVTDSFVGYLWLRARVTCSESLVGWNNQWKGEDYNSAFKAIGHLGQGEMEEWRISVQPVPVPAAVWLFGSGLVGMIGFSKRKKTA